MSEILKPCPFCGSEAEESFMGGGNVACGNSDCEAGMLMMYPRFWNMRPIEDKLLSQLAERDALIERLVWVGDGMTFKLRGQTVQVDKWDKLTTEWQAMKGGER